MAAFDASTPSPKDPPNFFYTAPKSIEQPAPNLARAKAYEGATTAIEEGSKGLDKFGKEAAEDVGYDEGQAAQSRYGLGVQAVHDTLLPQDATTDPNVPTPVKQGIDDITMAAAARNQGGTPAHVRETLYLRSLYQTASRLRAQWPGYRDYIDKGIEKATGITPNANAYIKSMLADINEVITKKNSGDQHDRNEVASAVGTGLPGAAEVYKAMNDGTKTVQQALMDINKLKGPEYSHKIIAARTAALDLNVKERDIQGKQWISEYAMPTVHNSWMAYLAANTGLTPEKLQDIGSGKLQLSEQDWDALGTAAKQFDLLTRTGLQNKAREGNIYLGDNPEQTLDIATSELKNWHKAIYDKDSGFLGQVTRHTKAMQDGVVNSIWTADKSDGKANFYRMAWVGKEMGGPNLPLLTKDLPHPDDVMAFIGNALDGSKVRGLANMKETFDAMAHHAGSKDKVDPADAAAYLRFPLASIQDSQVSDKAKINVFHHVFTGNNNQWFKDINQDSYDSNGNRINGKHSVFLGYTNPAFVSSIEKLGEHDPTLVPQYKEWVMNNFVDIFRQDLNNLNRMYSMEGQEGVKFAWLPGTTKKDAPHFETIPLPGIGTKYMSDAFNQNLKFLNEGIKAMHNVYGDATTSELMRQFREFEFNGTQSRINGLLMQGIGASKKPVEGSSKDQSTANEIKSEPKPVKTIPVTKPGRVRMNPAGEPEVVPQRNWFIKGLSDFMGKTQGQ